MTAKDLLRDIRGASLMEFAVTLPIFFLVLFGLIQVGMMLWAQIGLQHGVETASRCASLSDIAVVQGGATPATTHTPCYSANGNVTANVSTVKSFAAANSYGFNPPVGTFSVSLTAGTSTAPACNLISASYPFTAIHYLYSITLTASSCFPTVAS
jgi:Flp pilus assembly protein TadG